MIVAVTIWDERRLCDDGGCTGLIGSDGLCRVCGRASQFWGDERRRGMQDDDDADENDDEATASANGAAASDGAGDDDERRLCPDGSCTGVLDDRGRCKVCGKVDESARSLRVAAADDDAHDADDNDGADDSDDADGDDSDDDDGDRELCPDGGCTGLIGDDGACRVCGRRAEA